MICNVLGIDYMIHVVFAYLNMDHTDVLWGLGWIIVLFGLLRLISLGI